MPTAHVHHLGFAFGGGHFVVFILHEASTTRTVRLYTHDGLEGDELGAFLGCFIFEFLVGFLAAVEQFFYSVHASVVGECDSGHARFDGFIHEVRYLAHAVEHGVMRVNV